MITVCLEVAATCSSSILSLTVYYSEIGPKVKNTQSSSNKGFKKERAKEPKVQAQGSRKRKFQFNDLFYACAKL